MLIVSEVKINQRIRTQSAFILALRMTVIYIKPSIGPYRTSIGH